MVEIIPSILTNNPQELEEMLAFCEEVVDRIQIDIIDGIFTNNKTIDPSSLADIDSNLKIDFHLMVKEPIHWVERCIRGGADRIIGQIEMMNNQVEFVGKVQEVGASVGLAIDIDTDVDKLDPVILTNLDVVLVMSVKAGFGGQEFDVRAIDKIKRLDAIRVRDDTPFAICDDGGITLGSIHSIHAPGADEVSIGKRLFVGNLAQNIKKFQEAAHKTKTG